MNQDAATSATSIAALNGMPTEDFVARLGSVFEHSPWVATEAAALRPFAHADALHAAMMGAVLSRSLADRIDFLRAHPRLAARNRRADGIAVESQAEQKAAGLDVVEESKARRLDGLNIAYEERFGFPFIIAARRNTIDSIIEALQRRSQASREDEIGEALRQIAVITRGRLDDLLGQPSRG
jgi:2-oxo-4-hydroxy-4-carboxy-5-ureidoimidazoline decarboxylase